MKLAVMFHLLGVMIWVGGMFFAYVVLRPAASRLLAPPQRLPLWSGALSGFFRWVWVAVALVLGSGFYMVISISNAGRIPLYVHAMLYVGIVMTLIFAYVFFSPFPALRRAVAGEDWPLAGSRLDRIRRAVAVNLGLGLFNIVIATAGAM